MISFTQTLIVRNTLKPFRAVLTIIPGNWGCQWISLMSVWPWWIKSSWGGTSVFSSLLPSASVSLSTAKSQIEIMSSAPDTANTLLSVGCHSTEVMGAWWCLNVAQGLPSCWKKKKKQDQKFYKLNNIYFSSINIHKSKVGWL